MILWLFCAIFEIVWGAICLSTGATVGAITAGACLLVCLVMLARGA